jgi:hypothetical protein
MFIWSKIDGHDKFTSPMQAVDSFLGSMTACLKCDFEKDGKEKLREFLYERHDEP